MAAVRPNGEDGRKEARSMLVSNAFASLSMLFDECVRDVWKPLRPKQRDRLAQQIDDSLAEFAQKLDAKSFGAHAFLHLLDLFRCRRARSFILLSFLSAVLNSFSYLLLRTFSMKMAPFEFSKYHCRFCSPTSDTKKSA